MRRLIHVTHLLPMVLMDERASALRHAGGMQARACARMGCGPAMITLRYRPAR